MFHAIEQSDLEKFIRSKLEGVSLSKLAHPITSLIGLGNGLTPSMDDFLVGLISVFAFFDNHCELSFHRELLELTERKRHATNRVSASFLQSAVKHRFAQPVLELYDAFQSQNLDRIHHALNRILNIGHTSGSDSLNGILFGIRLLTELNPYSDYR
nr:DUF2877 domain-containing protein [Proteiniclasticum aestuarii]